MNPKRGSKGQGPWCGWVQGRAAKPSPANKRYKPTFTANKLTSAILYPRSKAAMHPEGGANSLLTTKKSNDNAPGSG